MNAEAISPTTLRIIIAIIGIAILLAIYFFGRPRRPGQGRRSVPRTRGDERIEPVVGDAVEGDAPSSPPQQGELDVDLQHELDRLGATVVAERTDHAPSSPPEKPEPMVGRRAEEFPVDRIVSIFVVAPTGEMFHGDDIVVAAEKAGLRFGAMHIYHRLVDGRPDAGPIFSMANMVKPGYFDLPHIDELMTPGVTFFATLPGPVSALDAWDAMLPASQRIAELLGGALLDEDRNALGRQRVAGLRDELRDWDRRHEADVIRAPHRR